MPPKTQKRSLRIINWSPLDEFKSFKSDDCKSNELDILKNKPSLGKGEYGSVYEACYKSDCKYVAKVIKLGNEDDVMFKWEYIISKRAGKKGYGPKVVYGALCRNNTIGIIVIERLERYVDLNEEKDRKNVVKVIKRMHGDGVVHRDLHDHNIMVDKNGKVFIIDYGFSFVVEGRIPWQLKTLDYVKTFYDDPNYLVEETSFPEYQIYDTLDQLEQMTTNYDYEKYVSEYYPEYDEWLNMKESLKDFIDI